LNYGNRTYYKLYNTDIHKIIHIKFIGQTHIDIHNIEVRGMEKEIEIIYKDNKPPCKMIRTNLPNFMLMAKAMRELYYETKLESVKN
jgi:hypothetical protein